jgi:hypothetical protein
VVLALSLFAGQSFFAGAQVAKRDYLLTEYEKKGGAASLDIAQWRTEKVKAFKQSIAALPESERSLILKLADSAAKKDWPSLKLSDFLKYKNDGNLEAYHTPSNARRVQLTNLVLGELLSGNTGKYMPQIADGLWLILEESTWVSPHHIFLQKSGEGLPDPNEQIIALRSGDVSAQISWIRLLLYDQLKSISPMLITKIDYELNHHIITPFLTRDDLHWLGFGTGKVNNWNIWINCNIMITALAAIDDEAVRNKVIAKVLRSADQFVNRYPEDGGCDEGVTYWSEAGGKLIYLVSLLTDASAGKLDWSDRRLIHDMGTYIYKMHIGDDQFVNFSDAFASNIPSPASVYLFGKVFNDPDMRQFAAYLRQLEEKKYSGSAALYSDLNFFVHNIAVRDSISKEKPVAPLLKENWLPSLQVLTLREQSGSKKGLFLAAKGGHNQESHNHNDIGNFVLYQDGRPMLIDLGIDTYTKQTFSKDRYTLFNMQSGWHNCPLINGIEQKEGRKFAAKGLSYTKNKLEEILTMDIANAYPVDAEVQSWKRSFVFQPARHSMQLKESYALKKFKVPFELHFMTVENVDVSKSGVLKIGNAASSIYMQYDPELFEPVIEHKEIQPGRLQDVWGSRVTRIVLKSRSTGTSGAYTIGFGSAKK